MTPYRLASAGFTLIELMITLVILAIVITIGVPSLQDFVAAQRVRTAASDLAGDLAYARAEGIKESRRAIIEPLGGDWKQGWQICVDLDGSDDCSDDEIRKVGAPIPGSNKACATRTELDAAIVFRPDGRAFYIKTTPPAQLLPVAAGDGVRISDDMADADAANNRVRLVYIGVSGRASVEIQDGGTPCS